MKLASIVSLLIVSTLVSCGSDKKKKSDDKDDDKPKLDQELPDDTGYLMFSPPPGTYEGPQTIVVRPRAISTTKTYTFEILNAETDSCPSSGPEAKCVRIKADKNIEYVVRLRETGGYNNETTQVPGIARYKINPAPPPTPTPTLAPTPNQADGVEVSIDGNNYTAIKATCSSGSVSFMLMNDQILGAKNITWFWFDIPANWNILRSLRSTGQAWLSGIRGNGDSSSSYSSKAGTCEVELSGVGQSTSSMNGFAGSISCNMVRDATATYPTNKEFAVTVNKWKCLY